MKGELMKKNGFTLIELMIVVAIVAFLAMIAVPNFMCFLAKAKRTEAYMNLHSIYAAQKAYFAENGTYSNLLNGQGGIGWKPEGYKGGGKQERFYYTYGFPGSEGKSCFTGKLETSVSHLNRARADKTGFVAVAAGDIDGDGKPDIITIDQDNAITIVEDDLND
jgi:prepilin-type N-terminal cleavage/methylation domain-containing protein